MPNLQLPDWPTFSYLLVSNRRHNFFSLPPSPMPHFSPRATMRCLCHSRNPVAFRQAILWMAGIEVFPLALPFSWFVLLMLL